MSERAIDQFFEAAAAPEVWPGALDSIISELKVDGATLMGGRSLPATTVTSTEIRGIVDDYFTWAAGIDSREQRVHPALSDGFLCDHDNYSAEELKRDPFYMEFLRPHGFGWHAAAMLEGGADPMILSLKRRWEHGPFERSELRAMAKTLPYLRAAAHVARLAVEMRSRDWLATLERRGHGAVLLDQRGRVMMNFAASIVGDGLTIIGGRLTAAMPTDQPMLDRLIGIVTSPLPPSELPPPMPVVLQRPSGKRPLVVTVARLSGSYPDPLGAGRAVVEIRDMGRLLLPPAATLRTVFDLTGREAELALLLCRGQTVVEAAASMGISPEHVRQRLKVIFQKTGTSRQGELVALLLRLA
ncbi:MAG: helix-turn-helix transcriptional regulator [Sphingomonadales bacterium]|nr:helix-turn-helix transcriptional regulator [Sphingomonadales bacterium]